MFQDSNPGNLALVTNRPSCFSCSTEKGRAAVLLGKYNGRREGTDKWQHMGSKLDKEGHEDRKG